METITIQQALNQINEILEKAFSGEEIFIKKNDEQIIKISSTLPSLPRPSLFGSDKDKIYIADNFDEPLEDFEEYM
jgi:antitoxin (DNA-binding transcriptional repressor) of toxin-antitoxin stability system